MSTFFKNLFMFMFLGIHTTHMTPHTIPTVSITMSPMPSMPTMPPLPTVITTPTSIPTPTIQALLTPQITAGVQDFMYPNATQVPTNQSTMIILESSDDPTTITNWYKGQIMNKHMNTTSIIQNNTNNAITNNLEASNGVEQVTIYITKPVNTQQVTITITTS